MTDAPDSDDASTGDDSDEEPADGSRIDEFVERFETDARSSPPPTEADATRSLVDEDIQSDPGADAEPITNDDEPTTNRHRATASGDQSTDSGRLWDSFGDGDADGEPRERAKETGGIDPESVGKTVRDSGDEVDTEPSPEAAANTPDSTAGGQTATESKREDEPGTESADSTTSFRSILDRISHRIGSVGSDGTDESNETEDSTGVSAGAKESTGGSAETEDPTGGSTGSRTTNRRGAGAATTDSTGGTGGPTGSGSAGESAQSDAIEEILNNIDIFARATSSSQVLLLSPTVHSITNDMYTRFLLPTDGSGQNVLFVSATQSASDQLAAAREIPNWREGKTAVIEVGQSALKRPRPGTEADITAQLDIHKQITNLNHLAKLGINISHIVSQWNGNRRPTVVGVHTLSAIQQYVGNETMFQFLFTLKGQLNSMGVMGFYHMDPAVHTENELDTIQSAFDLVIEVGSDGSVDIL